MGFIALEDVATKQFLDPIREPFYLDRWVNRVIFMGVVAVPLTLYFQAKRVLWTIFREATNVYGVVISRKFVPVAVSHFIDIWLLFFLPPLTWVHWRLPRDRFKVDAKFWGQWFMAYWVPLMWKPIVHFFFMFDDLEDLTGLEK